MKGAPSLSAHRPAAVVVGLDCTTGLQTARILSRHGIPVIGLASDPRHFCARTRAVTRVVAAPLEGGGLLNALERVADALTSPPALFPCTDPAVRTLARAQDRLAGRFRMSLPEATVVEELSDKTAFDDLARRAGLPVPRTCTIRGHGSALEAARSLRFPVILKPAVRDLRWDTGSPMKVHRAGSPDELLETARRCLAWSDELVAQEWIEGPDSELYSCNCYLSSDGRPLVTFVARKLRQWPPRAGTSCLGEECRNDAVLELALHLFSAVPYRGLGYVEVKRDRATGEHFLIEANVGRPTGRSAIAEAGGVELLLTAYCDMVGLPLPEARLQRYGGARWIFWRQDARSAFHDWRRGELSLKDWARSWQGRKACAVLSWSDPVPFVADLLGAPARAIRARRVQAPSSHTGTGGTAEYDLNGVVGLRLLEPSAGDRAAVDRQVGPPTGPLGRLPEITVRYVDALLDSGARFVDVGRTSFDEHGFCVAGRSSDRRWARIPFDSLGTPGEWVCERGIGALPFLKAALRLNAVAKGYLPFHGSAFEWEGTGVVVGGWTHGGKTSALLAFADAGARYVGDDLVFVEPGGREVFGFPAPLRLSSWHLSQLPRVRSGVGRRRRVVMAAAGALGRVSAGRRDSWKGGGGRVRGGLGALVTRLDERSRATLSIEQVFLAGVQPVTSARVLFLMASEAGSEVSVQPIAADEANLRMRHSLHFEDLPFMKAYHSFRFAFPERSNPLLEGLDRAYAQLLRSAFSEVPTYLVRHPYPAEFEDLRSAMAPVIRSAADAAASTRRLVVG